MEAISLAASIVAIGSAAATALKISRSLRNVARTLDAAGDDIEDFSLKIRAFGSIIQYGVGSLQRYTTRSSSSEVMKYLGDLEVLEHMALQSNHTTAKIKLAWRHTKSIQSSLTLVTRIKWFLAKPEVKALQPEMETLKTSLLLVMQSIRLEETRQGEDNEATRQEIEDLKRQMKVQIETIAILQASQARRKVQTPETGERSRRPSSKLNQSFENALVKLGQTMVEQDRVPTPEEYPPPSSRASAHTDSQGSSAPSTSPFHSISSRSQPSISVATSPVTPTEEVKRPEVLQPAAKTIPVVSAVVKVLEEVQHPDLRQERRSIPERTPRKRSISESVVPDQVNSTSTIDLQEHDNESMRYEKPSLVPIRLPDYFSEYPFNPGRRIIEEGGYITTLNGPVPASALSDEGLDYNLISLTDVQRFGLELEPLDDEHPVFFQTEKGEENCCGQVVLLWSEGVRDRKAFGVRCLVYEHDVRPLLFGIPFLDKRRDYWGGDGDSEVEVEEKVYQHKEKRRAV